jgi:hypothetical protein
MRPKLDLYGVFILGLAGFALITFITHAILRRLLCGSVSTGWSGTGRS